MMGMHSHQHHNLCCTTDEECNGGICIIVARQKHMGGGGGGGGNGHHHNYHDEEEEDCPSGWCGCAGGCNGPQHCNFNEEEQGHCVCDDGWMGQDCNTQRGGSNTTTLQNRKCCRDDTECGAQGGKCIAFSIDGVSLDELDDCQDEGAIGTCSCVGGCGPHGTCQIENNKEQYGGHGHYYHHSGMHCLCGDGTWSDMPCNDENGDNNEEESSQLRSSRIQESSGSQRSGPFSLWFVLHFCLFAIGLI